MAREVRATLGLTYIANVVCVRLAPPPLIARSSSIGSAGEVVLVRLDLGDLQLARRAARYRDGHDVAALVADQRAAHRRLVRKLVLGRVGLRRADDLVATDWPDFWSLTWTRQPTETTSVSIFFSSMTVALRSFSSSWAIRASSIACSFLAWSYSAFSLMSPNSRASLMRSATSRRLRRAQVLDLGLELLVSLGCEYYFSGHVSTYEKTPRPLAGGREPKRGTRKYSDALQRRQYSGAFGPDFRQSALLQRCARI